MLKFLFNYLFNKQSYRLPKPPANVGTYDYKSNPEDLKADKEFVFAWAEFIRGQLLNPINYIQQPLFKTFINSHEVRGYIYGHLCQALLDYQCIHDMPDSRGHAILSACYYNVFHVQSDWYRKATLDLLNEEKFKAGERVGQSDYHANKLSKSLKFRNLEKMVILMLPVNEAYGVCRKMGFNPDEYFKFDYDI
ncbi:Uncharacterised protein [Buttiauxella agrestis]|jgi:hypothetical protein|uniref:Uncharacterized protein n=1 Tax=Buttiauxella agrestis TaxID=82977 RepID=A0A381KQ49_9ENTR|nr:hypothetical protein [Buttiauxella agrestis]SUY92751.1 Uncharacterised protein [Buttiauxella agrestis]